MKQTNSDVALAENGEMIVNIIPTVVKSWVMEGFSFLLSFLSAELVILIRKIHLESRLESLRESVQDVKPRSV